jgi:hypothetical protein|tara:strand:+ start:10546 stop:11334 length:789 start_codon:yes stop_codon:yes gene_type:complete
MENKIHSIFQKDHAYINSDWSVKFRNETIRLLREKKVINNEIDELENIHEHVNNKSLIDYDFNSGVNGITKTLYDVDTKYMILYHKFLKDLYHKLGFDFYFQEFPTIRAHCPNAKNQHHYPRYHSDCFYGHPPQEINIWFTLTSNKNSGFYVINSNNSKKWLDEYSNDSKLFIENAINNEEFNSKGDSLAFEVETNLDKIFLFDPLCIHTNQPRTSDSRLSIDVRINPVEDFVDGYVGAGRMKAEFKPGGHFGYHKQSIKEI